MKFLKLSAFVLGGVAALLAAAVLYVAITFDAARVKGELKRVVSEQKQRTLDIEGDVALSIYPDLGLKLGRTSLSEHGSGELFAVVDNAHVSVAVLPLLSGTLVIDEIGVDGANVNIVRFKDGSLNFDDLMSKDKDDSTPIRFDIAGVHLSRSALTFRDEASGVSHALDGIELTVGKLANAARGKLDLAAHWTSAQPAADGRLSLAATYDYDLPAHRYALDALSARLEGSALDLKDLRASLTASRLEAAGEGLFGLKGVVLDVHALRAGEALTLKLLAPAMYAEAGELRGDEISLAGRMESNVRVADVRLLLKGMAGTLQAFKASSLSLDLDARQDAATLKATLATPVTLRVDGPAIELAALEGAFDIAHPSLPMKTVKLPVKGAASADFGKQTAAVNLDTRLDDSRMQLKLAVVRFDPLALDFDVDIDQLNLDRYLPPSAAKPAGNPDDAPVDLSALRGINANGSVKIGQLQASGVKMTNMRLEVKAANGKVEVSPYSASLYRGAATGALSLNADGNRIALKQTLSDIDIHPLIHDAAGKDMLEGRGTVMLDVVTAGATVGAMKKALDGSASLHLRDGAIRGINLAKSLREAKASLGGGTEAVQKASATEKTDFSELSASFRIEDGVARNKDLSASSPFLRLAGAGSINLVDASMGYLARVTLAATSKGQDGKGVADLKGVTVPVKLYGPFASLDYRIEFGDMLKEGARAAIDGQSQKLQQKAREKVGERLKGLLLP
jgi:AsmA protein